MRLAHLDEAEGRALQQAGWLQLRAGHGRQDVSGSLG